MFELEKCTYYVPFYDYSKWKTYVNGKRAKLAFDKTYVSCDCTGCKTKGRYFND